MLRRIVFLLVVGVFATLVSACHPSTNTQRCDDLLSIQAELISSMGGWLRCDPSYTSDEPSTATHVIQWNRTPTPQYWLWDKRLSDRALQIDAWIGVYETYQYRAGRIPDFYLHTQKWGVPDAMEQAAFEWAVQQVA